MSGHFPLNLQVNPSWTPFNVLKERGHIYPLPLQNKWKRENLKSSFIWNPISHNHCSKWDVFSILILTLSDLQLFFALITPESILQYS